MGVTQAKHLLLIGLGNTEVIESEWGFHNCETSQGLLGAEGFEEPGKLWPTDRKPGYPAAPQ